MAPLTRRSDLSPRQRHLVETMQRVRFGRIEHLIVYNGEPVIERSATRVIRTVRFDGEHGPHPALDRDDTVLKAKVVALLRRLDELGNGTVAVLHFGDGLPGSMEIDDDASDQPGLKSPFLPGRAPVGGATVNKIQ